MSHVRGVASEAVAEIDDAAAEAALVQQLEPGTDPGG